MASPGDEIIDAVVRHRIGLNRYSTSVVRKIIALLNRSERSIIERLVRTSNETIAGQRLEAILAEIRAIQSQGWLVVKARLGEDIAALAVAFEQGLPIVPAMLQPEQPNLFSYTAVKRDDLAA